MCVNEKNQKFEQTLILVKTLILHENITKKSKTTQTDFW